jgi:hypothetical protein
MHDRRDITDLALNFFRSRHQDTPLQGCRRVRERTYTE